MNFLNALDRTLGRIERGISVATLVAVVVATSAGVIFRYGFNSPLLWSNDVGTLSLMWLTFVGASMVMRGEGHIAIDVVLRALPAAPQRILTGAMLAGIAAALVCVLLAMLDILPIQNKTLIDALNISRAAYGVPVLWMCLSMMIHIAVRFANGIKTGDEAP